MLIHNYHSFLSAMPSLLIRKAFSLIKTSKQVTTFLGIISVFFLSLFNLCKAQSIGENVHVDTESKITALGAEGDNFGDSVAISEDMAVVGAPYDDDAGNNSGSAYVFALSDGVWTQQARLIALDSAPGDNFGDSVAISGNTAVVGAPWKDNSDSPLGSVYVFTRSDGVWIQQAKLTAPDATKGDNFGESIAIFGDTAVVGVNYPSAVYVFARSNGIWTQQSKLIPTDGVIPEGYGESVAIFGDTAVVGAANGGAPFLDFGSVYAFKRSEGEWTQQAKLTPLDARRSQHLGGSVAISKDTIVAGAGTWGAFIPDVYIFARSDGVWEQQAKLISPETEISYSFGESVAISGNSVVIGAPDDGDDSSGSAYIFIRSGGVWTLQAKLTAPDAGANDRFASTVAIFGDTIMVGAPYDDDSGINSGSAYIYKTITDRIVTIEFDSTRSSSANESDLPVSVTVKLALLGTEELSRKVSVDVINAGTGTARIGEDYVPFTTTTLTFPEGSRDGATQSFNLDIIQDDGMEDNETIQLELANLQGEAILGDSVTHKVTIRDDDTPLDGQGRIYWTDGNRNNIRRMNLDGSNFKEIVPANVIDPTGIAVDGVGGKIYWQEFGSRFVRRANLDGSKVEDFLDWRFTKGIVNGLTIDVSSGSIFTAHTNRDGFGTYYPTRITQKRLNDGTANSIGPKEPFSDFDPDEFNFGVGFTAAIVADLQDGKLYWTDNEGIWRSNLDGNEIELFINVRSSSVQNDYPGSN